MPKKFRIKLSYTKREWIQIDQSVRDLGKKSDFHFLIGEIKNLEHSFLNFHPVDAMNLQCQKREYRLPPESEAILTKLSSRLKIPASTLVARLLFNPLLKK